MMFGLTLDHFSTITISVGGVGTAMEWLNDLKYFYSYPK